ncbi:MAG: LytR/AlgR family response regulator transcription factor [Spirosomataceae bacterium]
MKVLILEDKVTSGEKVSNLLRNYDKAIEVDTVSTLREAFNWVKINQLSDSKSGYKNRFLVKTGNNILFKNVEEIAYFFADDKIVYLVCNDAKQYIVDYRLEQLENLLDPHKFYRANRKFLVKIDSIQRIKSLSNSRLQLFLKPSIEQDIFISKDKIKEFKTWLDQ